MAKIDINLRASRVLIEHDASFKGVVVEIEQVSTDEVLEYFTISEIIEHYKDSNLLDEIGIDRVKEYFNLQDKEDQP